VREERKQMQKWISIEEKMPEDRQDVLTYWPERRLIQLQAYVPDGPAGMDWWLGGWQNLMVEDGNITHWMPLPEPPM